MPQIFNLPQQTNLRKVLRNQLTKGERIVWQKLSNSKLGFKFRRQCGIGKYIVDFYCPLLKLVIEIDGLSHDNEMATEYDEIRQKYLESLGIKVKRYTSEQIFNNLEEVIESIRQICLEISQNKNLRNM